MASASGVPRRVSMAYILGFSNKPFKDGGPPAPSQPPPPPPRHPGAFKQMVTTPGGVIEWAASDGRRGRLTGPGKPRLTSNHLAQVPPGETVVKAGSNAGGANNDTSADDGWTAEQDEKLMEMKTENKGWKAIAEVVGKESGQCKAHFKEIKLKDWKPDVSKGGGGGNKQKQGKQKEEKGQKEDAKKKDEKKGGQQKDSWAGCKDDSGDGIWSGGGGWNLAGDTSKSSSGNDAWVDVDGGFNLADDDKKGENGKSDNGSKGTKGEPGNHKDEEGFKANEATWETTKGESGGNGTTGSWGAAPWGSPGNTKTENAGGNISGDWNNGPAFNNSNEDSGWDPAPVVKPPSNPDSKPHSTKSASHAPPKQHSSREPERPSTTAPTEYELKPDSTFSANDLRLVARILQQDYQMVWNRVSWRFRDKTGRDLHPEVFEKKITGRIEGKDDERGRK
ncbi:uncharacterized protein EKO05_0008960 [Ascochyta rabiei]|nr:uncharacterized protein EKO05_0008960 [Ascochyta rabiei]UPX18668.1 hypothetical protein EKO05_0008960 [Ascochyta rabiei]